MYWWTLYFTLVICFNAFHIRFITLTLITSSLSVLHLIQYTTPAPIFHFCFRCCMRPKFLFNWELVWHKWYTLHLSVSWRAQWHVTKPPDRENWFTSKQSLYCSCTLYMLLCTVQYSTCYSSLYTVHWTYTRGVTTSSVLYCKRSI